MKIYKHNGLCNIAGQHIHATREARHMTQEQLAAKLQVEGVQLSQRAISRAETGDRVIADYELKAFARVLGLPVDTLLDDVQQ